MIKEGRLAIKGSHIALVEVRVQSVPDKPLGDLLSLGRSDPLIDDVAPDQHDFFAAGQFFEAGQDEVGGGLRPLCFELLEVGEQKGVALVLAQQQEVPAWPEDWEDEQLCPVAVVVQGPELGCRPAEGHVATPLSMVTLPNSRNGLLGLPLQQTKFHNFSELSRTRIVEGHSPR
jgi:hypothetical protein